MKKYTSVRDLVSAPDAVKEALSLKQSQNISALYQRQGALSAIFQ